jgi:hypothetical protein
MITKTLPVFLAILTTACASTDFSKTGDYSSDKLADNCPITIYTTAPKKEFNELGVIDISNFCFIYCGGNSTANGAKNIVQKDVCQAGGNAILLWESTAGGLYKKATVIKTL